MKRLLTVFVFVVTASVAVPLLAQDGSARALGLEQLVEARLTAGEPVHLTADTTTLVGDTLRLEGNVRIRLADGQFILADAATIDRAAHHVTITGDVRAHLKATGRSPVRIEPR